MFEDDGAVGARNFDAARVTGICGGGGMKNAEGAACKLKQSRGRVFRFNLMELSGCLRLHARNVPEQPEQQINCVNALIDQRPTAVQCQRAAPTRILVIFRGPVPFHARIHEQNLP